MRAYPRPEQHQLAVERVPVEAVCDRCGGDDVRSYPVLGEGGWWDVEKCQRCLSSVRRRRGGYFGGLELRTADIPGIRSADVLGRRR